MDTVVTTYTNGQARSKRVKNMGWLLHKLKDVERVTIIRQEDSSAELHVELTNNRTFEATYASYDICLSVMHSRRALRGVPIITIDRYGIHEGTIQGVGSMHDRRS